MKRMTIHLVFLSSLAAFLHAAPVTIERIDSVLICVKDLKAAKAFYSGIFGSTFYDIEPLALYAIGASASAIDGAGLRLIAITDDAGIGGRYIRAAGEGLIGFCCKVPDIEIAVTAMKEANVRCIARKENATRKEALFDPEDTKGILLQFMEYYQDYYIGSIVLAEYVSSRTGAAMTSPLIERIDHYIHYVPDIKSASAFFEGILRTRFPAPRAAKVPMTVDGYGIELIQESGRGMTAERTANGWKCEAAFAHVSVKVRDFDASREALEKAGYAVTQKNIQKSRKVAILEKKNAAGFEIIVYDRMIHETAALELKAKMTGK